MNKKHRKEYPLTEKLIVFFFLVFSILALIVLFRGSPEASMTGFVTNDLQLNKTSYNGNELLKGKLVLSLQPLDILPGNSSMAIYILTNSPKCSTKYLCPNNLAINWYKINSTTGACDIIEEDPEGECCKSAGTNCAQVILNKGFDAGIDSWTKIYSPPTAFGPDSVGTDNVAVGVDDEDENILIYSKAVFEDTSTATRNSSITLKQILGARKTKVSDFGPPPFSPPSSPGCTDSDGGINYGIAGSCNDTSGKHTDICDKDNKLIEWHCNPNTQLCEYENYSCDSIGVCSNGACTECSGIECTIPSSPPGGEGSGEGFTGAIINNSILEVPIPITGFASGDSEKKNTLKWSIAWEQVTDQTCAFEIIVKSNSSRNLHYYYKLDNTYCSYTASDTDKYIELQEPEVSVSPDTMNWDKQELDIYTNWTNLFTNGDNDYINEILLVSYAKVLSDVPYAQKVWLDYITLTKYSYQENPSMNQCIYRGKKCCNEGTGFGVYYGDQLECSTGDCWASCANSTKVSLSKLISLFSNNKQKYNTTEGDCQYVTAGSTEPISLNDYCIPGYAGKGYTACLNTNASAPLNCKNWTGTPNTYEINLSQFNLKAPNQNGIYTFVVNFSYNTSDPEAEPINIFLLTKQFSVGQNISCQSNWTYPYGTNWSDCISNSQWRTKQDLAQCVSPYIINETQSCGTTPVWNCTWQPCTTGPQEKLCTCIENCDENNLTYVSENRTTCCIESWQGSWSACIDGTKTKTYQDANNCDTGFNKPENETMGCGETPSIFKRWYVLAAIVLVLIVIFVILLKTVLKKPKKGMYSSQGASTQTTQQGQYPELVSYIKDALASGVSKEETKTRLQEAGWPEDAINDSFKAVGV